MSMNINKQYYTFFGMKPVKMPYNEAVFWAILGYAVIYEHNPAEHLVGKE